MSTCVLASCDLEFRWWDLAIKKGKRGLRLLISLLMTVFFIDLNLRSGRNYLKGVEIVLLLLLLLASLSPIRAFLLEKGGAVGPRAGAAEIEAAQSVFNGLQSFLPGRVCREDLGDALEQVGRLVEEGAPRWKVHVKIANSVLWACLNGCRELISGWGRKSSDQSGG